METGRGPIPVGGVMRKVIRSSDAPKPRGVYSQAIIADNLVFVSGQGPVNPDTNEVESGDIKSQTRRTLRNIDAILHAAGSSLRQAMRMGVFLADIKDFAAMNEVFQEFFPENPPARTTIGAALPGIRIEIDCIASLARRQKKG
jgi:2-iminobutanoate/2-iminopropanoate deaminase